MNHKFLCFLFTIIASISTSTAQILSKSEIKALFLKHKSLISENSISDNDPILVQLARPLTIREMEQIKPLRNFSIHHFVIRRKFTAQLGSIITAETKANALWKAGVQLSKLYEQSGTQNRIVTIHIALNTLPKTVSAIPEFLKNYQIDETNQVITAQIQISNLMAVLENETVIFADIARNPSEEIVVNGLDLSTNELSAVHQRYPEINGSGVTVSVKEGMFDSADLDIAANITQLPSLLAAVNGHATIMATLILGRGNSFIRALGAAPFAKLTSSDFSNLLPDDVRQLNGLKVNVQNHSYGTDLEDLYGIEAAAYDRQVFEADTMIHVFSAGNKGTTTPQSGQYTGIPNSANLTGNFKQAKNILVVGGISRENKPEALSSRGPAYDGRVKPDLVALGEDGTSGAAALTTGVVALLQQKYKMTYGKMPSAATVRSILINSADDLGSPQVDYVTGFGKVNALKSLQTITEGRFRTAGMVQGGEFTLPLQVTSAQKEIKVTLAWTDPAAATGSVLGIVNHLDLSLETPAGTRILPWTLNNYPDADSLALPATRKADELNTVQQLTLENIPSGNYTIHVKGRKITQQSQDFSVAYQLKPADYFQWTYPEKDDAIFAAEDNYLRWENSYQDKTGKLSVSYDNGTNWTLLGETASLTGNYFKWGTPNLFSRAILKMEINQKQYLSNSFIVSAPITLNVGYNCADKLLLHWKAQPSAKGYTVYNLKDNALTPIKQITDTLVELDKTALSSPYLAIAANGNDFSGLKSYTINYNNQGVSCYVRTFTGSIEAETVQLALALGTTYQLKSLIWEKQSNPGIFVPLFTTNVISGQLSYTTADSHPVPGPQFYRVTFLTTENLRITSDIIKVNFLQEAGFTTYPNPVTDYLSIISGDFKAYDISLFNLSGQKLIQAEGAGTRQLNVSALTPGVYLAVISRNGVILKRIKVIKAAP